RRDPQRGQPEPRHGDRGWRRGAARHRLFGLAGRTGHRRVGPCRRRPGHPRSCRGVARAGGRAAGLTMPYGLKIAIRYLTAGKAQTALLTLGVAVGVFVFIFISALIGGLGVYLVQRTVGDIAHVTVEPPSRDAGLLLRADAGEVLLAAQPAMTQREQLRTAAAFLPLIEQLPGVASASPQIVGNGFLVRGQ